ADYKDVDSIYNEADLFIATYKQNILETELSYRTRVSEAMYGRLPVIVSGGDIVSDFVKEYKTGIVIDNKSEAEIAQSIISLDKKQISTMKKNIEKFLSNNTWNKLIDPLDNFCRKPFTDKTKKDFIFEQLVDSRRDFLLHLRDDRDKKEGHNKDLQEELNQRKNDISKSKEDTHVFENLLTERDAEINDFKRILIDIKKENAIITEKKNEIVREKDEIVREKDRIIEIVTEKNKELIKERDEKEYIISELKKKISFLEGKLGDIRHSITYPLYKITHSFGKTNFGKILQKLLK
ncbi:MAG: glycosyltransferase, partial [Nanoarchaeota archaeon]